MAPRPPWLMRLHERQRIREIREYLRPGAVTYVSGEEIEAGALSVRAAQLGMRRILEAAAASAKRWANVQPGDTIRVKRYP